jgi:ribosomal protein L32E
VSAYQVKFYEKRGRKWRNKKNIDSKIRLIYAHSILN